MVFKIGDRVRVAIVDKYPYAFGAVEAFNGKVGTIKNGKYSDDTFLVVFDTPAEPWRSQQSPVTGFCFPSGDLKKEK